MNTPSEGLALIAIAANLADPARREDAAHRLARLFGADDLHLFFADAETGTLHAAPGLTEVLPDPAAWSAFLDRCLSAGAAEGPLLQAGGGIVRATGVAVPGAVAVLTRTEDAAGGPGPAAPVSAPEKSGSRVPAPAAPAPDPAGLRMVLPFLGPLFAAEARGSVATREAEAAHRAAEAARAEAAEANRAKSDFLATMSHELRTPINAVLGFEQLLAMEIAGPLNPGQHAHLERIRASGRHLLLLINDILDLARVETGQLIVGHGRDSIDTVLAESIGLMQRQYEERGITLSCNDAGPSPLYYGDRDRVRQILSNLLSNALKFTAPGGSVAITRGTTSVPPTELTLAGASRWTYVNVEDTGIGIAPEHMAGLFEPFGQVERGPTRRQGGSGLGLTISRQLARLMGGDLTVSSALGEGSCFSLWLPADRPVEGQLDPSIRVPVPGAGS